MSEHAGNLSLGDILQATGSPAPRKIVAIRHVFNPQSESGLRSTADVTPERILSYTAGQKAPMFARSDLWLVFIADRSTRSRFSVAYDNHGEIPERAEGDGYLTYDLRPSEYLSALRNRLVIEWSNPVSWYMGGEAASRLSVTEIADPEAVPFPGYDRVLLTYPELQAMVTDPRYATWQSALRSVAAIYAIADTRTGKKYVGMAAGNSNLLGRWTDYAMSGHGGNVELVGLHRVDPDYARHFVFSILRVFGPTTPLQEIIDAETHFKDALLTRRPFGLNLN